MKLFDVFIYYCISNYSARLPDRKPHQYLVAYWTVAVAGRTTNIMGCLPTHQMPCVCA